MPVCFAPRRRHRKGIAWLMTLLLPCLLAFPGAEVQAADPPVLDCPLRDAPFSVDSPLMDALLSPTATVVPREQLAVACRPLPPQLSSTPKPSFAAIMTPRMQLAIVQAPPVTVDTLRAALGPVPVNPERLPHSEFVVWNKVSGDMLTLTQRGEFENCVDNGGVFLGIHGSGWDSNYS